MESNNAADASATEDSEAGGHGACDPCDGEKHEEEAERLRLQALPRQCKECKKRKQGEEFPPIQHTWAATNFCLTCVKEKEHDQAITEALEMKRCFGVQYYKYEPGEDKISFVPTPTLASQEKKLRKDLQGKYHIVYIRAIGEDNCGILKRSVIPGGTVTVNEKEIEVSSDEDPEQTATQTVLCGEIDLQSDHISCSTGYCLMKDKFEFVEKCCRYKSEAESPAAKRRITDWDASLELPDYRDEDGVWSATSDDDETHENYLKPHGSIKIIGERHPCRLFPSEHPFEDCGNSYDHDEHRFRDLDEAQRLVGDHEESSTSWLCNHLQVPSQAARIIHDFVAWRPKPVFFFEPGDLWIKTRTKWSGDNGREQTSCYLIARQANKSCDDAIKTEQAIQKALQFRYNEKPFPCEWCKQIHSRAYYQGLMSDWEHLCQACTKVCKNRRAYKDAVQKLKQGTVFYKCLDNKFDFWKAEGHRQGNVNLAGTYDLIFRYSPSQWFPTQRTIQGTLEIVNGEHVGCFRGMVEYQDSSRYDHRRSGSNFEFFIRPGPRYGTYHARFVIPASPSESELADCGGYISIHDQRVALPWSLREKIEYDDDVMKFDTMEEAEELLTKSKGDPSETRCSWLMNHLRLPRDVTNHIYSFIAWARPDPVFFIEKGDLWIHIHETAEYNMQVTYLLARRRVS